MNILLLALAAVLLAPIAVLCAECLAAMLPARRIRGGRRPADSSIHTVSSATPRPPIAVLVPAHNEEAVLSSTLTSLMPQLQVGDRLIVIADNCDDSTVAIARGFGATVVERTEILRRGKGYALDHGLRFLDNQPPAIVMMFDADCTIHSGAIEALAAQVIATDRPAQALYLMDQPRNAGARDLVSALAFLVKNWVRPRGLFRLKLPCLLTGTGMAFPWSAIAGAKLASGNIVEDMQLGLDLALQSRAPLFCESARVTGHFPTLTKIAYGQRTRWEHGHLQTLLTQVPRVFKAAFSHWRSEAMALAMEIAVPPLCLLMMLMIGALGALMAAAILGAAWLPAQLIGGGIAAVAICLFCAWAKFGRKSLPLTALLAAPFYMAWKVPMYLAFLFQRHTEWNRTARSEQIAATTWTSSPAVLAAPSALNVDIAAPPTHRRVPALHRAQFGGADDPNAPLARLRTLVLLGGSVRPTRLSLAIRRSILDLPLEDGRSILCHWHDHAARLCREIGLEQLLVRVLVDQISHRPTALGAASQAQAPGVRLEIERDASRYRGTAGVLHDLSHAYADDDYILVANAAQAMLRPLSALAGELAAPSADITLIAHHDGTPSGLMLVRCAALRSIAATGYVDMKEQALPNLARQFDVQHLPYPSPTGLPVRILPEYIGALQHRYRMRLGYPITANPFSEDCRPSFSIVEDGAVVAPSAKIYDSVILRGAQIGEGALVVRSLVCPETHLVSGERVIDQLVTEASIARPGQEAHYGGGVGGTASGFTVNVR